MRKFTGAAWMALGSVTGSMMFGGTIVTGCASNSSGDDVNVTEDSGVDSTAPGIDSGVDGGHDSSIGTFDSGQETGDSGEATGDADSGTQAEVDGDTGVATADAGTDASDSAEGTGDAGDAGTGIGDASNAGDSNADSGDTGATSDASDAGAASGEGGEDGGSEAAADGGRDAEAGCSSSIAALADGGAAVLITGFDISVTTGWSAHTENSESDAGITGSVAYSAAVGRTCPGSIAMTVPFTQYAFQKVALDYNYQTDANILNYPLWTNFTKMHYWLKIAFEGTDGGALASEAGAGYYSSLNDTYSFTQWNSYNSGTYSNSTSVAFLTGTSFSGQEWQEVVLDLTDPSFALDGGQVPQGADCSSGNACQIESQVQIEQNSGMTGVVPAGGSPTPTTTILYVDDIWLE